jgi:Uma2 family endonuclease
MGQKGDAHISPLARLPDKGVEAMTILKMRSPPEIDYLDSDGQPMGETPRHVRVILDTYESLDVRYADRQDVFVAANMFVHYVRGDRTKHVSPDVFATFGIDKNKQPERRSYLLWEEGKGPDFALEVTSSTTREEDLEDKYALYQDVLKVGEYFLFDPYGEHLEPALKGFRLSKGEYVPIKPRKGRLPSKVLGLHLEENQGELRLYDPSTDRWLLTPREAIAEAERLRAELERLQKE